MEKISVLAISARPERRGNDRVARLGKRRDFDLVEERSSAVIHVNSILLYDGAMSVDKLRCSHTWVGCSSPIGDIREMDCQSI